MCFHLIVSDKQVLLETFNGFRLIVSDKQILFETFSGFRLIFSILYLSFLLYRKVPGRNSLHSLSNPVCDRQALRSLRNHCVPCDTVFKFLVVSQSAWKKFIAFLE